MKHLYSSMHLRGGTTYPYVFLKDYACIESCGVCHIGLHNGSTVLKAHSGICGAAAPAARPRLFLLYHYIDQGLYIIDPDIDHPACCERDLKTGMEFFLPSSLAVCMHCWELCHSGLSSTLDV